MPGNRKKEARKTDLQCSTLAGHTIQVAMTAATKCGFEVLLHPHIHLKLLLLTSIFSWYTIWKKQ